MSTPASAERLRTDVDDLDEDVGELKVDLAKLTAAVEAHERRDDDRHGAVMSAIGDVKIALDRAQATREAQASAQIAAVQAGEAERTKRLQILAGVLTAALTLAGAVYGAAQTQAGQAAAAAIVEAVDTEAGP